MRPNISLIVKSLVICLFWNAVLAGVLFFLVSHAVGETRQFLESSLSNAGLSITEDTRQVLEALRLLIDRIERWTLPVLCALGLGIALVQAGMLTFWSRGVSNRGLSEGSQSSDTSARVDTAQPPAIRYAQSEPQAAAQILSILQRKGRFIDFLEEDLSLYEDAQIGAAVRSVHQGCKDALSEHLSLKPILAEEEGGEVSVPAGFDPAEIQLIGEVKGAPPFKGILRHRGWRVDRLELPRRTSDEKEERILAPAEIEVSG
jgi:hypothetical protein